MKNKNQREINNQLLKELYSIFGNNAPNLIAAYNAKFGTNYMGSSVYAWNKGTVPFPILTHDWARSIVIPVIAPDYSLTPEILTEIVNRLVCTEK